MSDQDPRYEWHEISNLSGHIAWFRGRCRHTKVVPVEAGGETVAHLCLTCDQQLPPDWP